MRKNSSLSSSLINLKSQSNILKSQFLIEISQYQPHEGPFPPSLTGLILQYWSFKAYQTKIEFKKKLTLNFTTIIFRQLLAMNLKSLPGDNQSALFKSLLASFSDLSFRCSPYPRLGFDHSLFIKQLFKAFILS